MRAPNDAALRERVRELMPRAFTDLSTMVGYASVYDPGQLPPPADCDGIVDWLCEAFVELGFTDTRAYPTSDGSKTVIGQRLARDAGPDTPTVLLYFHHDVQPAGDEGSWTTSPWQLTDRDGRWYGRGAADCKGNIAMVLTALRGLGDDVGVNLRIVGEGSEEQGTGGLEDFVPRHPELLDADVILILDAGNFAVGEPALTTSLRGMASVVVSVDALESAVHSGMYGGAAPDALAALIAMLASLRDAAGNTTIAGLDSTATWSGVDYPADRFRTDATVLDSVGLLGDGRVSDMLWARPAATVIGIDAPAVSGSSASIVPSARARINLRVPATMDVKQARDALAAHLRAAAPWQVRVDVETEADGAGFAGRTDGPGFAALTQAMEAAYGQTAQQLGQGGSIPLCTVLAETFPNAEIMLLGVEEPACLIHAPDESVAASEVEAMSFVLARFLRDLTG